MTEDELANLFASHVVERRKRFETGGRLVHYTNAEAAYKIIKSRRIWLRNASMMNDFSEIQHGLHCLTNAWASEAGVKLQAMLNRIKDGLHNELATLFDGHTDAMKLGTFIISLSEHDDDEDELGRLSMWRAYGARAGVALVLNNTTFAAVTDAMKVYSAPVFYHSVAQFEAWFAGWADGLLAAEAQLGEVDPVSIQTWMFYALRSFALCTKHPGFAGRTRMARILFDHFRRRNRMGHAGGRNDRGRSPTGDETQPSRQHGQRCHGRGTGDVVQPGNHRTLRTPAASACEYRDGAR